MKLYYYPDDKGGMFHCYTSCSCSFDIYELVSRHYKIKGQELNFNECVNWVSSKVGKSQGFGFVIDEREEKEDDLFEWFGRFDRKKVEYPEPNLYSDRILEVFSNYHHESFLSDGISHQAMSKFNIRFYDRENAVAIPHRYYKTGEILGIKLRNLDSHKIQAGFKYLPAKIQNVQYNFPSYSNLYGLFENKNNISRLKKASLFESEKSVLQVETLFGRENNFSVALSGKNISDNQVNMLLGLGIEEITINLDKDFEDLNDPKARIMTDNILKIGRKFAPYVRVYTTFDVNGLLGKSESPSDRGMCVLQTLMREKQEILNIGDDVKYKVNI